MSVFGGFFLFIQADIGNKPGLKAELIVWNAMKEYFAARDSFAFLHYPMFNQEFKGRREIDILIVDKEIGLSVIEVKGLKIDQIESIQGPVWNYRDFYEEQGSPYLQAEKQLDMLCNRLEKNPLLYRTFSKRVVIALPYITRSEWESKGFHRLLHAPPILFKDDLSEAKCFNKLSNCYIYNSGDALNYRQWSEMLGIFSVTDQTPAVAPNIYSSLFVFSSEKQFLAEKDYIKQALNQGTKIFLLSYFEIPEKWVQQYQSFIDEYQLLLYTSNTTSILKDKVIIHDGENFTENLGNQLSKDFKKFNLGQYKATHAPIGEHLMVTAGAGTGKTHVMVDRILFLLTKADIFLKDIIMITFTNESTNEMKERLQEKLINLSKLTRQTKYGIYAEDIKEMQLSTIHSFAKSILVSLAHEIGYGRNVQLRSFVKKKKEIIEQLANEYIHKFPVSEIVDLDFRHYELVDVIYDFWEEMEKKGLTKDEIKALEWGTATKPSYKIIQGLFKFVFKHCEDRLDQEKKRENAVSMGDLIRKIKGFSKDETKMKQLQLNKYVFVDEFQDSDNVQIEMVASLANYLNYHLFVVGDVKQSIYRFRGADYKSFDQLNQKVNSKFIELSLNQNYRTSQSVLEKLDKLFSAWGKKGWLSYSLTNDNDRLRGMNKGNNFANEFQFLHAKNDKAAKEMMIGAIQASLKITKTLPEKSNRKIALIVRTNSQALTVKKWCDENNITTQQNLDGTFFTSAAVRDFKSLLDGLLYPDDAKFVVNALQSPYFRYEIPYQVLLPFLGRSRDILSFINSKISDDFMQYVKQLKVLPVLAIIQKIISEKGILHYLADYLGKREENQEQIEVVVKQYQKNLFHLLNMIQQQFSTMNCTLFTLNEWLTLQMRTNRTENEPVLESDEQTVTITTVHRSKGLEYHTVIMPKTDYPFEIDRTTFYIQEENEVVDNKRKVGWYIKNHDHNNFYSELSDFERDEINKEETRLLYVAMTRTKKRLVVILPSWNKENTWSALIKATGIQEVQNGR
jgi:ATP-dependent exoDNAse (exonuclease V) beta subunit